VTLNIPFIVPYFGEVKFVVYDILGRTVLKKSGMYSAGTHRFEFDANKSQNELASGIYLIRMTFGEKSILRKAILVK